MKVNVEWGPPGKQGVQTIMGLGADEIAANSDNTDKILTMASWASLAAWAVGAVTGNKQIRDVGLGGSLVAFIVKYATK